MILGMFLMTALQNMEVMASTRSIWGSVQEDIKLLLAHLRRLGVPRRCFSSTTAQQKPWCILVPTSMNKCLPLFWHRNAILWWILMVYWSLWFPQIGLSDPKNDTTYPQDGAPQLAPVIRWFLNPTNYTYISYIYHKPYLNHSHLNWTLFGPPDSHLAATDRPAAICSHHRSPAPRLADGWGLPWLVVDLPLWKIWVRQLGWWNSQYMEK